MSKNVFSLNGATVVSDSEPINDHLIEKLRDLLARAESGELRSLIATGIMGDRARLSMFSCSSDFPYDLLGAVIMMQNQLVQFTAECEEAELDNG